VRRAVIAAAVVFALAGCATSPAATPGALSGTVTVFAAASLTESFDEIAAAFEAEHPGVDVVLNYGGSSGLATQIAEGAPADVFAAASTAQLPDGTVFATNVLALAVPAGNPGDVSGLPDLARPELAIALCAVEVPCGAASATLLEQVGITASVDTFEQDVKAVLTKIEFGEVDAGLVYVTDVQAAGAAVEGIALAEAEPVAYPIAALSDSAAANAFVAFVLSETGQTVLREAGFGAP
jgi:molybdate transport system substrate-binding protein